MVTMPSAGAGHLPGIAFASANSTPDEG